MNRKDATGLADTSFHDDLDTGRQHSGHVATIGVAQAHAHFT
jgi:hypothetical protein